MAIGNENLQPPRTPQSNHNTQKFVLEKALASEGSDSNRVDHVQVPSSIPMNTEETEPKEDGGQDASVNEYQSGKEEHSLRNPIEEPAISPESHAEDVGERNSAEQNKNDLELPFFDWIKFEKEYQAAMSLADEEENLLITEFEKVCGAFSCWADAAGQHDHERAVKRLKTRERYVQISEDKFQERKNHYVVDAFKKALELLRT